jgi:hypothetical protein
LYRNGKQKTVSIIEIFPDKLLIIFVES